METLIKSLISIIILFCTVYSAPLFARRIRIEWVERKRQISCSNEKAKVDSNLAHSKKLMAEREYFSLRTKQNLGKIDLDFASLKEMILAIYSDFSNQYYFQEAFGYECVDSGFNPGIAGSNIGYFFLRKLRKQNIWPIETHIENYSEDDLFDLIEILYDLVSEPVDGYYHRWNNCGWHYSSFKKREGQKKYRDEINSVLCDYKGGFELSNSGEILIKCEEGLEELLQVEIPEVDPENIDSRIKVAIQKFRYSRSSEHERKEAVRILADILEYLKSSQITQLPKNDESDLFNIANNFGIRHHNLKQKTKYDGEIWLDWIFYIYLASIHLSLRIHERDET